MSAVEPGFQLMDLDFGTRAANLFLYCSQCVLGIPDGKPASAELGTHTEREIKSALPWHTSPAHPGTPALCTLAHQPCSH